MRTRATARVRPGRDCAGPGRRVDRACPVCGNSPEPKMSSAKSTPAAMKRRLVAVVLDEKSIGRSNPDVEHERPVAIYDLLEQNTFTPVGHDDGPFPRHLSINGNRPVFDIRREDGTRVIAHRFS